MLHSDREQWLFLLSLCIFHQLRMIEHLTVGQMLWKQHSSIPSTSKRHPLCLVHTEQGSGDTKRELTRQWLKQVVPKYISIQEGRKARC